MRLIAAAHLSGITSLCGDSFGCSQVLGSRYASIAGIPAALLGMLGYFLVFSATTLALVEYRWELSLLNGLVAVMFIGTLRFLYLQTGVLHAFCPFCLLCERSRRHSSRDAYFGTTCAQVPEPDNVCL